ESQDGGDVLKGVEVAKVASQADMIAEEANHAPADVPSEAVVVGREDAGRCQVHTSLNQADSALYIRAHRTELGNEHHVAHCRQHAGVESGCVAKEVGCVGD